MKIFISWSGDAARKCAEALKRELPHINPEIDPWVSSVGIGKGERAMEEILESLRGSRSGIVCLTRENQQRQWINFETGALSMAAPSEQRASARVRTFLIDLPPKEISGPLKLFQATDSASRKEVYSMIESLNAECAYSHDPDQLRTVFVPVWERLQKDLRDIRRRMPPAQAREMPEVLDELVGLVREQNRRIAALEAKLGAPDAAPAPVEAVGQGAGIAPQRPSGEEDRTGHVIGGVSEILGRTHVVRADAHAGEISVICDGEGYRKAKEEGNGGLRRLVDWCRMPIKVSHGEDSVVFAPSS
ncbi:hypothetical protein ACIRD8_04185 [Streptomyces sp. NPDC102451]|uniref:hypothetical protein n=1 Tax=Streptomyces sp. NPDC102451 TaxID=3366177 RepID=UPI0038302E0C